MKQIRAWSICTSAWVNITCLVFLLSYSLPSAANRLIVEFEAEHASYDPSIGRMVWKFKIPETAVDLDESLAGKSQSIDIEISSRVEFVGRLASCQMKPNNNTATISINPHGNFLQVDVPADIGHVTVICTTSRQVPIPVWRYWPFTFSELAEGTPVLHTHRSDAGSMATGGSTTKGTMKATFEGCFPQPGLSGDGSVTFVSTPPEGTKPWPVHEVVSIDGREINRRFPNRKGRVVKGKTISGFLGSKPLIAPPASILTEEEAKKYTLVSPQIDPKWESPKVGSAQCLYLDKLTMVFPGVVVIIPKDYADAHPQRCWYSRFVITR